MEMIYIGQDNLPDFEIRNKYRYRNYSVDVVKDYNGKVIFEISNNIFPGIKISVLKGGKCFLELKHVYANNGPIMDTLIKEISDAPDLMRILERDREKLSKIEGDV